MRRDRRYLVEDQAHRMTEGDMLRATASIEEGFDTYTVAVARVGLAFEDLTPREYTRRERLMFAVSEHRIAGREWLLDHGDDVVIAICAGVLLAVVIATFAQL